MTWKICSSVLLKRLRLPARTDISDDKSHVAVYGLLQLLRQFLDQSRPFPTALETAKHSIIGYNGYILNASRRHPYRHIDYLSPHGWHPIFADCARELILDSSIKSATFVFLPSGEG
jgi:hypothetical protein